MKGTPEEQRRIKIASIRRIANESKFPGEREAANAALKRLNVPTVTDRLSEVFAEVFAQHREKRTESPTTATEILQRQAAAETLWRQADLLFRSQIRSNLWRKHYYDWSSTS